MKIYLADAVHRSVEVGREANVKRKRNGERALRSELPAAPNASSAFET
jgi:hypothetical protein